MKIIATVALALSIGTYAPLPESGSIEVPAGVRKSAACPAARACVWAGYWDSADQGSLWYYTLTRLRDGVSWRGTAADLNTSSWYNRTSGYMLMSDQDNCTTAVGRYVRLAPGQAANGRNPATDWDNAFRSVFTQPPNPC